MSTKEPNEKRIREKILQASRRAEKIVDKGLQKTKGRNNRSCPSEAQ